MPIETDLSVSPYFSSHDPTDNYHHILFKPGVAVQVRELQDLQRILQEQIERFGNNIFKRGTIIDGCNFIFYDNYPYAKILDTQIDGAAATPSAYVGKMVRNAANLVAYVVDFEDGFESTDPDLKTIYLKYLNSGTTGTATKFSAGQALTVYDANNTVERVTINNGGTLFSNGDTLVFVSAMAVNVTSGSFSVGNIITQNNDTYTAYAEILEVNTTAIANTTIIKVKPRESDLVNASINSLSWTFVANGTVANSTTSAEILEIYGSGAQGEIITNGSGKITTISVTSGGTDYDIDPHVSVKTKDTRASLGALSLTAQTYIGQIRVASVANAVGNGYAFGVTEGIIYQKGYFVRVEPQTIIVTKYSTAPNNLSAIFTTEEEIINSNIDTSLLDNVLGTENENAPGADRLKLVPTLEIVTSDEITANDDVFAICEWSDGRPYRQNQKTEYDVIGDAMAENVRDVAGDFVKDRFLVTTKSPNDSTLEANTVTIVVDPGTAYISGYKVETTANFILDVPKGISNVAKSNSYISLDYGSFIRLREVVGVWQFDTGDTVDLYDTVAEYLSNTTKVQTGTISPVGNKIGTARMRSMVLNDGRPGEPSADYYLYLFDIQMNSGKRFRDVQSVYYNSSGYKGIADVAESVNADANDRFPQLRGVGNKDKLLFHCGYNYPKNINAVTYEYRTVDQTAQMSNTGEIVITLAASDEFFPYGSGTVSEADLDDLYIVPTAANLTCNQWTGTVSVSPAAGVNVTGTGTAFFSDARSGLYMLVSGNSTQQEIRRIERVVNNTFLVVEDAFTITNAAANVYHSFPKNVPIPLRNVPGSANVDITGKILTIDTTKDVRVSGNSNVAVAFNVERRNATQITKTVQRDVFVKIRCNTHVDTTDGPWCLGVPEIIRLKKVYVAETTTVNVNSADVTSNFFIDHNQTPNFLGLGYLYKNPYGNYTLPQNAVLLVQFDALVSSGSGFATLASYIPTDANTLWTQDSTSLANATNFINSFEVPEVVGYAGKEYDLLRYIDFRPIVSNTAALSNTVAGATINPAETVSFGNTADPTNNKKFPVPGSRLVAGVEVWQGRIDSVFVNKDGRIFTLRGDYATKKAKETPQDSMLLNTVVIPPYPALPARLSRQMREILDRRIANDKFNWGRVRENRIETNIVDAEMAKFQPKGYTHAEIGKLERRIEDLEYYTALSLLESTMKDKQIPSSLDRVTNRYKYGFFIDDYNTLNFTDLDSPEYSSDIENNRVVPETKQTVVIGDPSDNEFDYEHRAFITQRQATQRSGGGGSGGNTGSNTGGTTTAYLYAREKNRNRKAKYHGVKEEPIRVTMSSTAGEAVMWMNFYGQPDKIEVYQGGDLILDGDDAVQITNAERRELLRDEFFKSKATADELDNGADSGPVGAGGLVKKAAKLVIPHSPSGGRNYTIKVTKYSGLWRFRLDYPVDSGEDDGAAGTTSRPKKSKFRGTIYDFDNLKPGQIRKLIGKRNKKSALDENDDKSGKQSDLVILKLLESSNDQKVLVYVAGLKPLTEHSFFVKSTDETENCDQINTVQGEMIDEGSLKSDKDGKIIFAYTYTPDIETQLGSQAFVDNEEYVIALDVTVINSDGSSVAEGIIDVDLNDDDEMQGGLDYIP